MLTTPNGSPMNGRSPALPFTCDGFLDCISRLFPGLHLHVFICEVRSCVAQEQRTAGDCAGGCGVAGGAPIAARRRRRCRARRRGVRSSGPCRQQAWWCVPFKVSLAAKYASGPICYGCVNGALSNTMRLLLHSWLCCSSSVRRSFASFLHPS